MKVSLDVDCTPDEARTFCGLPNVEPMQEAAMARIETRMLEAITAMSPDGLQLSLVPQDAEQFRDLFARFSKAPFDVPPSDRN